MRRESYGELQMGRATDGGALGEWLRRVTEGRGGGYVYVCMKTKKVLTSEVFTAV